MKADVCWFDVHVNYVELMQDSQVPLKILEFYFAILDIIDILKG